MKYSIKKQMTVAFTGLIVCMILGLLIINVRFLEPYYIQNKQKEFVRMYESLKAASEEPNLDDEEVTGELTRIAEKSNLTFILIEFAKNTGITNVPDKERLLQQLMGYILNQQQQNCEILESTPHYQIGLCEDPRQPGYLEMWGDTENGYFFLIRSPIESMRDSVAVFNRFLLYIGLAVIAICSGLVWYFSKKLTDPIQELTALSARMVNMDFDAKYTSGGHNEIGVLGTNFNAMSEKLERSISELRNANYHLQMDIERKEKLEQMRNEFLANISHELKTPIALVQGYAEGLKEGVNTDAQSREFYCDVIVDEASKMNEMVKNLLALNQLEFGNEDVEFARFDLKELIQGVLQSMEILVQQKEANIIFRVEQSVYVWADEYKVEQVVRNYVSNALHHLDGERVIEVKIATVENKVRVAVFNTGTPIPKEDIDRIWDKFYKVDKARTREYGGNGIGLSIVKAIMESFQQEYGVNNYDNGVEFWFELDVG